jgi:hypothetical protein
MRYSILIVIFLALVTVFSAYAVVYTQGLPASKTSVATIGTYTLQGNYDYVATLAPNPLYNTTTIAQGEGPLFTAIVKTINVKYSCTLFLSQPGTVDAQASYQVTLSGGAWDKTLQQASQVAQGSNVETANLSQSFQLNVTSIVSLAREIGTELQYPSATYLVQVSPDVGGSVTEAGRTVPLDFVQPLNLTISDGVITPNGTSYLQQGNITGDVKVIYSNVVSYRNASIALLGGSVALLALNSYYVVRVEEVKPEEPKDDIDMKIRPYMEVIAATATPPQEGKSISMLKWEDLVKVADTLGKPILKYEESGQGWMKYVFWVSDGELTYSYQYVAKPGWAI